MTKKYVQPGKVIDHVATSQVLSGNALVIGILLAVALGDIATGDTGSVQIEGVFEMPKLPAADIAAGALLTWDVGAQQFIVAGATTGDLAACAVAIEPAGAATTTVLAKLIPGNGTVTA